MGSTDVMLHEMISQTGETIKHLCFQACPTCGIYSTKGGEKRELSALMLPWISNNLFNFFFPGFLGQQVFPFGSVPLKTYLPDGDIDLTAFSKSPNLKDTWANEVRDILEREEKSGDAEFRVKEVQYIQAEVCPI